MLTSKLKELVDRKNELNSNSPQIPDLADRKAKAGIAAGRQAEGNTGPPTPGRTRQAAAIAADASARWHRCKLRIDAKLAGETDEEILQ